MGRLSQHCSKVIYALFDEVTMDDENAGFVLRRRLLCASSGLLMAWSSSEAYTGDYYLPAGKSVRFCALWETAVRTRILCRMCSVLLRVLLRVSFLVCLFLCTYVVQCLWYMFITSVKLHTRRWSSKAVFLSVTVMAIRRLS